MARFESMELEKGVGKPSAALMFGDLKLTGPEGAVVFRLQQGTVLEFPKGGFGEVSVLSIEEMPYDEFQGLLRDTSAIIIPNAPVAITIEKEQSDRRIGMGVNSADALKLVTEFLLTHGMRMNVGPAKWEDPETVQLNGAPVNRFPVTGEVFISQTP